MTTGAFTNSGATTGGTGDLTTAGLTNSGTLSTSTLATVVNGDLSITGGSVLVRGASLAVTGTLSNSGTLDTAAASTSLTGAGATTVTGAGQYKQSAARQVLFYDGFESGNFTTGGWVTSAGGAPPDAQVVATPPGAGAFVANLPKGDAWVNNWITKARSTAGQSGIWLTFGRATTATAGSYTLTIEYSLDGGASWKTAKSIPGTFGYVSDAVNLSVLDPAVENNAGFQFRFHSYRSAVGNYHYIDEVRLEAGTAGLGPLTVSGGGTKTIDPTNAALELVVAGPLTLSAGTVRIAGGKSLSLDARAAVTSTSAAGTLLDVEPDATLKLSAGTTLNLAGTLEVLGLAGLPAKITTTDTVTPGRYALSVSGTFNGSSFDLNYANALGLNLAAGCAVTALNDGAFHRPPAGGALLTLGTTTPPAVSTGCSFANELGAAGAVSVDGSLNSSAIRFDRATGVLAGEAFDRDFGAVTPGNVTWGPTLLAFTTPALTVAAGSCNAVTVEARDQSGIAGKVVADIVLGLASTSAGSTFYADASCAGAPITSSTIASPASSSTFYFSDTTVGTPTVTVSASGFGSIMQTHTINPGPAAKVGFTVQPSATTAGVVIAPAVQVAVQDSLGNTVTSSTASITVAIGTNPGGGTLSGTLTVAAVAGVATFPDLSINKSGTGYTLNATSGLLASATSAPFDIAPGAAARLVFAIAPSSTTAGAAISPAPSVTVQDALGNTVTSSTASITMAIDTNPSLGVLSGTLTVAAVAGVASFSTLSIDKAGTGYTLVASSGALAAATSPAFEILVGAPAKLVFITQPTSAGAGVTIAPPVRIAVQDALGNTVTASSATINLAIGANPGAATLSGGGATAASSGVASYAGLSLDKTGVGYTLAASSAGLSPATSAIFDVTAAPPAKLVFTSAPLTVTAGACSPPATIGLQDSFGNAALAATPIVANLASGSPTLSFHAAADTLCATPLSPAALSIALGGSAVAFRLRDTRVGGPAVSATATGLTPATQTETIVAGAPARLVFASPPQTVAAGACSGPTVVRIEDAHGNAAPVASATTLSLASSSTGNAFFGLTCSPPPAATAVVLAGNSTATFHFQDTVSGTPALTVSGATLPPVSQVETITGAAATALVLSGVPATMQAGVAAGFQLTARDGFGNVATDYTGTVSFTSSDPLATLPPPAGFTLANAGTRSFSLTLATLGAQSLTATDGAMPPLVVTAGNIQVVAGPAASLAVSGVSSPTTAGSSSDLTVEAKDALGNRASGYLGTVSFGSSDSAASLTASYTFVAADLGRRTLSQAVTLRTPGTQRVTATDTVDPAITGAQAGIVVLQKPGGVCAGAADCGSGQCAQGVCCATACAGACQACNLAGMEGTCSVVPDGSPCADALYCNGNESCQVGVCTPGAPVSCVDPAGREVLGCDEASQSCKAVPNAPPKIVRDAILTAAVGLPYAYNAFGAVLAAGARPLAFAACGGPSGFKLDALTGAVSWTPGEVGPVPLCVKATNAFGEDTVPFTVQVALAAGQGPIASFTVSPPSGPVALTASFDGSASTADASSALAAWRWDYGDFAPLGAGKTSSWDYLLAGGYQPMLTVIDEAGRSGSAKRPVQVRSASGQKPPLARIVASAQEGEGSLSVDFSCDCQPGDAEITAWRWDFADAVGAGASVTRVFAPGRYRVHLTAVDRNGLTGTDSVEISVARTGGAQPPQCQAQLSPPSGMAPLKVNHLASARASTGQIASVLQSFGDGGSSDRIEVELRYDAAGRYPVKLTVTDDQGLVCHDSVEAVAIGADGAVPPRILSLAPTTAVTCGQTYVYPAAAAGSAPFLWSLAGGDGAAIPDRMTIDEAGMLTWLPTSNDTGVKRVTVRVSNAAGSDEQRVEIEVGCGEPAHFAVGCGCGSSDPVAPLLAGLFVLAWYTAGRRRRSV
ncbi:MAG: PKD domain-containing protein [Myxococcaceae bacterium]